MTGLDYVSAYKGKYWEAQKAWICDMAPSKGAFPRLSCTMTSMLSESAAKLIDPICDVISLRKNWQTVYTCNGKALNEAYPGVYLHA